ncbi:hypothetical protein JCM3770_001699 [Rhodotorula araucariae]
MSDLRGELKEWERAFRAEQGRDPTKDDIREQPAIAAKYKEYAKLKAGKGKGTGKPASSESAQPKAPPPPLNPFKTPTKPKPSRSVARPAAASSSTGAAAIAGSPTKRLSGSKPVSGSAPTFILANSPSKLRALAAAHSSSGSPNRPQGGAWSSAMLAPSESVAVMPSPQKRAANPFASPQKGTFGELERAERERLRAKKRAERERRAQAGVLGAKATTQGAGWGGAAGAGARGAFARTASVASSTMDLDEVDDFFSSQSSAAPAAAGGSQRLLAQLAKASPTRPAPIAFLGDDDEVFGPSPVKRPADPSADAAVASQPRRVFQPLVPDSPPSSLRAARAPSAPAPAPAKPKPFASSLPASAALFPPASSSSSSSTMRKRAPADADADTALDDGDDDFYADALDKAEAALAAGGGGGTKGKGKGKGRARARTVGGAGAQAKRKKVDGGAAGKGKARAAEGVEWEMDLDAEDAGADSDAEVRVVSSSRAGELVLDVEREEALGGGRERLVIHEKGWRERLKAQKREERRKRAEAAGDGAEGDAVDVDVAESDDDDDVVDDVSLFHRRKPVDLLARHGAEVLAPAATDVESDAHTQRRDLAASLPADLASVLSLRNSPQKSQSIAKERQVARLLGEPAARRKQRGLLELEGEAVEPGTAANDREEGDDDWDEEPDGWKATGDAMDGYYSSDGW